MTRDAGGHDWSREVEGFVSALGVLTWTASPVGVLILASPVHCICRFLAEHNLGGVMRSVSLVIFWNAAMIIEAI